MPPIKENDDKDKRVVVPFVTRTESEDYALVGCSCRKIKAGEHPPDVLFPTRNYEFRLQPTASCTAKYGAGGYFGHIELQEYRTNESRFVACLPEGVCEYSQQEVYDVQQVTNSQPLYSHLLLDWKWRSNFGVHLDYGKNKWFRFHIWLYKRGVAAPIFQCWTNPFIIHSKPSAYFKSAYDKKRQRALADLPVTELGHPNWPNVGVPTNFPCIPAKMGTAGAMVTPQRQMPLEWAAPPNKKSKPLVATTVPNTVHPAQLQQMQQAAHAATNGELAGDVNLLLNLSSSSNPDDSVRHPARTVKRETESNTLIFPNTQPIATTTALSFRMGVGQQPPPASIPSQSGGSDAITTHPQLKINSADSVPSQLLPNPDTSSLPSPIMLNANSSQGAFNPIFNNLSQDSMNLGGNSNMEIMRTSMGNISDLFNEESRHSFSTSVLHMGSTSLIPAVA